MACKASSSQADCSEHHLEIDIIQSLAEGVAISCTSQRIIDAPVISKDIHKEPLVCIGDDDGLSDGPSLGKCVAQTQVFSLNQSRKLTENLMWEEDRMGMTVTAGSVTLPKNESNLIGISIGGGGKYCPCLYVVQVFDNTAASRDGTLQSGDEIAGVNSVNVKGKSKTEVAQLIQRSQGDVIIHYNKLHPDPKQGKSLDIALKKVKHRLVESMSSSTADALGLSRAILCNDALVKKLDDLSQAEQMYRALIDHAKLVFKAFFDLIQVYKKFGDVFCGIGVRELQQSANEAFNQFGEAHRTMEKYGIQMLKRLKPILGDLGTYLHKAIPDTRLTIKRYADVKFEYLSYCLKVKEMDDEEIQFTQLQEPLYRVETGNYEYRLVLRCRQEARASFARLRSDVLVKLELLDSKHVQHLTAQLTRLVSLLAAHHSQCQQLMHDKHWFPIELDLAGTTLWRAADVGSDVQEYHDEEDEEEETNEDTSEVDDNLLDAEEATQEDLVESDSNNHLSEVTNEQLLLGQLEGLSFTGQLGLGAGGEFSSTNEDSTTVMGLTDAPIGVGMQSSAVNMASLILSDAGQQSSHLIADTSNFVSGGGFLTPSSANAVSQSMMQQTNMMTGSQQNNVMLPFQQGNMMGIQTKMMMPQYPNTIVPQSLESKLMPQQSMMSFSQGILSSTGPSTINDPNESSCLLSHALTPNITGLESIRSADLKSFKINSSGDGVLSSSQRPVNQSSKPVSGLSQLSQELMNGDPFDVEKQLEGFMSPCKGSTTSLANPLERSSATPLQDVPLLQASEELKSFLCGPDASTETLDHGNADDTNVAKEKSEIKDKQDDMEDVNLLDGF